MVLWHKNTHIYPNTNFHTFSYAFLNRYPNPFASHILSIDVLHTEFTNSENDNNKNNTLKITRIIKKSGKLPQWIKPFLGKINQSVIMEVLYVNKDRQVLESYTRNLDHTKIIQVEEYTEYKYNPGRESIEVESKVKFTSGFNAYRNRLGTSVVADSSSSSSSSSFSSSEREVTTGRELITGNNDQEIPTSPFKKFSLFNLDLSSKIEQWSHTKFSENIKKTRNGMNYVLENIKLNNETPRNVGVRGESQDRECTNSSNAKSESVTSSL